MRLAAHIEAEEERAAAAARQKRRTESSPVEEEDGEGEGEETSKEAPPPSEVVGLVLLASAYHVPDGGNPIFALPLPVLSLLKPVISQVGGRLLGFGGGGTHDVVIAVRGSLRAAACLPLESTNKRRQETDATND